MSTVERIIVAFRTSVQPQVVQSIISVARQNVDVQMGLEQRIYLGVSKVQRGPVAAARRLSSVASGASSSSARATYAAS